jgi:phospholipase/lecithinase/hemolysin
MKNGHLQRLSFAILLVLMGCEATGPNPTAPILDQPVSPALSRAHHASLRRIISFGDSFSDVGNLHLATGGTFAGPPYFEGRFTNGPAWVEDLAERLGVPAVSPSLAGGTGHAWGGARTGPGTVFGAIPNVGTQIEEFLVGEELSADDLLVIWVGTNDGLVYVGSGGVSGSEPQAAVANIAQHISDLAAAGGTHFLVPDLYSLGSAPMLAGTPEADAADAWAETFNELLEDELERLEETLGVRAIHLEVGELFDEIIGDPEDFDLTNVTDQACGGCAIGTGGGDLAANPDEYLWWDQVHFTRVVHELVGAAAAEEVLHGDHDGRPSRPARPHRRPRKLGSRGR